MYGKTFAKMFQGSMVGSGSNVFAVWCYCITNADHDLHTVDLNPFLLSAILGDTKEKIDSAINYLSSPDANSHNTEYEGRRIINTCGHEYFIVSHANYRNMRNNEELREYFKESKRKQRESIKMSKTIQDSLETPASASASVSGINKEFSLFWDAYPKTIRKTGKDKCLKFWERHSLSEKADAIMEGLRGWSTSRDWTKNDGEFICAPLAWLHQSKWESFSKLEGDCSGYADPFGLMPGILAQEKREAQQ
jgi:hypothetical protein